MQRIWFLALAAVISMLSACASVPMASLERDNEAKKFTVEAGKSNIYLYRNEVFGSAITMPVALDGRIAGRTGPETYYKWVVTPGEHEITSLTENTANLRINAREGRNHFVWQEVKMGMWTARSKLHEVSEEEGRAGVNECKLAAPPTN